MANLQFTQSLTSALLLLEQYFLLQFTRVSGLTNQVKSITIIFCRSTFDDETIQCKFTIPVEIILITFEFALYN